MGLSAEQHPAFQEELDRLDRTLNQVDSQLKRLASTTEITIEDVDEEEESMHAIRAAQEALETLRESAVERLKVAVREPYFGRIDFAEAGEKRPHPLYIGKAGVKDAKTNQPLIIDWRAPVASLFYTSAAGGQDRVAYQAPEGLIEGSLWLKRNLAIKGGRLRHIADAKVKGDPKDAPEDAPGGDTYLLYRLQESRDNKLRDIVSTIQQEQNAIIRAEKDRPLIIQGVAGSGKTTVALHRLAYLLYTYRETMDSDRMVIFAPNRMFLDYIADVLPELGVGGIRQVTFQDWALDQIDEPLKLVDPGERLQQLFAPGLDPGEGELVSGRFKGALGFKEALERTLTQYEATLVPEVDLELWEGSRVDHTEIYRWFHQQYAGYPINTRKERVISRLRTWAKLQVDPYKGTMEEDHRKKAMQTAVRQYVTLWPKHTPLTLYKEILGLGAPKGKRPADLGDPDIPAVVTGEARDLFKHKVIAPEDLAPLVYLQERLHGLREDRQLDHVVIDEAQDFSPFQIDLLRRLTQNDSFTILGDLSQGIHTYTGIADWSEFMAVFPPGSVEYHVLRQSYRSTYEIMSFANQVLIRIGATAALAEPVFRAGEKIQVRQQSESELPEAIAAAVRQMQVEHASVAVVTRTATEADHLFHFLGSTGLDVARVTADQKQYRGGLSVIPSYLTKGLEFDGVIVANANAHNYRLSPRDARLLYVSLTRSLHKLTVFHTGDRTPLLSEVPEDLYTG
jgi:DNA helicase-2/ATP-dependent DNA helicase PcrA